MSTVAKTLYGALQTNESLEKMNHFKKAATKVSNFRYSLIHERESLPDLLKGRTIQEIESLKKTYEDLGNNCLEWIWTCQSHIDNPNSDKCYRERTKANFPTILQEISKFQETRKSIFPEDVLPEDYVDEPSDSESEKESDVCKYYEIVINPTGLYLSSLEIIGPA